jgi:mono/diheme cytochrome c family protein
MNRKVTLGLGALAVVAAVILSVPALAARQRSSEPGDVVNGKKVYIQFCGKCHALKAAGARGTLGPNLDLDKVSYVRVVSSIEEGVGGIQAEYVLRNVTFSQVYDVAKYVVTYRAAGGTHGEAD